MANGMKQNCSFIGWVGNDIEVTESNKTKVGKLRIATDGGRKKNKEGGGYTQLTTWLDVTVFNNDAVFCEKYVKKGEQIAFDALFKNNEWKTKEGKKQYGLDIIGSNLEKLGKKGQDTALPTETFLADIEE